MAQTFLSLSHGACAHDVRQDYADRQEEMRTHVQWKWSVVNASCGATQAWMLSLAFALCFVTKS